MNKFLISGTGEDINQINFYDIDGEFITAGVNRVYEKFIPDYFYIYDLKDVMFMPDLVNVRQLPDEIKTIYTHPDKLYEYFYKTRNYKHNFSTFYDDTYTDGFTYEGKHYKCNQSSVNYLIRMLNSYLYRGETNKFYIVGCPLLEEKGHFYDDPDTTTKQPVLDKFYNDFLRLKKLNYNIVSLMEESKLNDIFPKEDINIIYKD